MKPVFKTLAVVACTAACALTLPACNIGKSTQLGKPALAEYPDYKEIVDDGFVSFRKKVDEFSSALAPSIYKTREGEGNFAVSPVSVYMALSLAAECADGETRTEVLNALGVSYEQLRAHISTLYRSLNNEIKSGLQVTSSLKLGNSIWVNEGTAVKQDCIDALSDYYFSYSYSADFKNDNGNANKAVRNFVKKQTNGLIDTDFGLSTETLFALINTLYLKSVWNSDGRDLPFAKDKYDFVQSGGTVKNTELLQGYYERGRVYEAETYSTFYTSTLNGYKIKFILPNDGYTADDVFTAENISEANSVSDYNSTDEVNKIRYYTRCLFPEYKAKFDGEIKEVLKSEFGINQLFKIEECNFSALTDEAAYCEKIRHVTTLTVDRKGIEGAAVTVLAGAGAAGPDEYEEVYRDFVVNKAFGFIITDSRDVALFTGVVNNV